MKSQGYFDYHLYSTTKYRIENTDTFKVKDDLYLRYNPEPDIWQVGSVHDKFFWIGSMFRDEKKIDKLHSNEFTVVDIYQSHGTMEQVVDKYLEILRTLEKELKLPNLSLLEVDHISHKEFSKLGKGKSNDKHWLVVTEYPTRESFYDLQGEYTENTLKFEIFYVDGDRVIEIAACGNLGENLNITNYISGEADFLNKDILQKKFIGFGIGLERLVSLYY